MKKVWTYLVIAFIALLASVNYELFVFPNQFAPSGINGICTMIQYVTGVSVGYLSLFINIPLAIWCYFEVSRPMAVRSMVYVVTFSLGLLILEKVDLSAFAYVTENGTSKILGPMVAGVIQGFVYSILIKASAYTGGTDFISAIVHKHSPNRTFFGMSFAINSAIAIVSYFVYGCQMEPVILCILYTFMSTTVGDRLMKSGREAICFEIITNSPQEVSRELIDRLHHTATFIPARGMYSGRHFGGYVHACFLFHFFEPGQALYADAFEAARFGAGFPDSCAEYLHSFSRQLLGCVHYLFFCLGTAWAGND